MSSFVTIQSAQLIRKISYKLFPTKFRLFTHDEYNQEADDYTLLALSELQKYCKSPDCDICKIMSRVKRSHK